MAEKQPQMNRAVSADEFVLHAPGALPQAAIQKSRFQRSISLLFNESFEIVQICFDSVGNGAAKRGHHGQSNDGASVRAGSEGYDSSSGSISERAPNESSFRNAQRDLQHRVMLLTIQTYRYGKMIGIESV